MDHFIKIKSQRILSRQSINTRMTVSWHVVTKLLTVSRISKVDYQYKVLPYFKLDINDILKQIDSYFSFYFFKY